MLLFKQPVCASFALRLQLFKQLVCVSVALRLKTARLR